jgi:menaquinone-9 beta-reductase
VENHVLLIGDAAGMITPLCGNGMSMALTGSKIAAELISSFLNNTIDRAGMESMYEHHWKAQFSRRLSAGRLIQNAFGKTWTANVLVKTLRYFPGIARTIIRQTHG